MTAEAVAYRVQWCLGWSTVCRYWPSLLSSIMIINTSLNITYTKLNSEQLSVEWDVEMFHRVLRLV